MTSPQGDGCEVQIESPLATIVFGSRESPRSAMSVSLVEALSRAMDDVDRRESVKAVVFIGRGRVFGVGADLTQMAEMSEAEREGYLDRGQQLIARVLRAPCVTIAAVNGVAFGGAFELALACDLRWTQPGAVFWFPECSLGLVPAWGGSLLVRQRVPWSLAVELLCGRRVGARMACAAGLASRHLAARSFLADVRQQAGHLVQGPPDALRRLKELWRDRLDLESHFAEERRIFLEQFSRYRSSSSPGSWGGPRG